MQVRFVDIDGVNTRYYVAGEGPALLLIHGVGASADVWSRVMEALGERFTVYAPDLIGHGFTDAVDFAGAPPQQVQLRQLLGFVDRLGIGRFAAAGASFGALLAALMYFARPDTVERLVLIGSGSVFNPPDEQAEVLQAVLRNQIGAMRNPSRDTIRARNAGSTYGKADIFEEIVLTQLTAYALPGRERALQQTVDGLIATVRSSEYRVLERLEQIAVPTLVLTGRDDPRAGWQHVETGCRRMPQATMRIFEACGHKPYSEHPRAFTEAVLGFLAEA
ncbi:MAG: alpha/beta fold hydrolase [Alphaproteobacteria bacterium]